MSELHRPTVIITGHMNADYDALAAMVAAGKIYPEATLVAPTILERQGEHVFSDGITYLFNMHPSKECDFSDVKLLVVVDTHQSSRIDHVKDALDNPDLEIHVYDHHPDSDNDLPATKSTLKMWGSTTTILTHIIKEQGIQLNPDEATMLGLGLYEDTGSFTFNSTTVHDFTAAAFLHESGMNLEIIGDLVSTDLTREQVHLLDRLLKNAVTHNIQGITVTLTEIVLDSYIGDFASLVHKFVDMESTKAIFALAVMGDRVHIIGRSRIPDVDVGQICSSFGGGGHSFAASATVKQVPLAEVKSKLLTLLVSSVMPQLTVGKHMTSPAITVEKTQTIELAEEIMHRYGLKAIPVLESGSRQCVGILELHTANRANTHKLGHLTVAEYMQRNINTLTPEDDLYLAVEIILKERQRLIPILENNEIIGVLTRTDIIRLLIDDTLHIPESTPLSQDHKERNVAALLRGQLPAQHVHILEEAGKLGDALNMTVFSVGGFVRDLILRQPNFDIDLSVEGDAIEFAQEFANRLGGRMRPHHKFGTAIVFYNDDDGIEQHLDIATARLEYYESPAALPTVELSSIKMDLYRRDFTINALAIQLNEDRFGTLIDPFGAQRDMKEKSITVLHSLSFIEDPTRILRAVRFEIRYSFRINVQTERLIKNALSLDMISKLSNTRLFNEFKHVFNERDVPACLRRMEGWNLLQKIHPLMKLSPTKDILIASIDEMLAWHKLLYKTPTPRNWVVYMLGLCVNAKYPEVATLLDRLGFIERAKIDFQQLREAVRKASNQLAALHKEGSACKSALYEILRPVNIEGLLFLMANHGQTHNIGQDVSLYLTKLRDVKIDITGADICNLGEQPGPLFTKVLQQVLAAKLDGKISTREEQLAFASNYLVVSREGKDLALLNLTEVLSGRT